LGVNTGGIVNSRVKYTLVRMGIFIPWNFLMFPLLGKLIARFREIKRGVLRPLFGH